MAVLLATHQVYFLINLVITNYEPQTKHDFLTHGIYFSGCAPVVLSYDKDECRDTIENNGGRIIDKVGNESKGSKHPLYLISDSFARTVKFIYCVAAGIPCLSYKWIEECNKLVSLKVFLL
jgi:hypothetical protein